ncbi:MAG: CHAP domain-containing protein [Solirubrobacteraceae bacterium]
MRRGRRAMRLVLLGAASSGLAAGLVLVAICGVVFAALGGSLAGCTATSLASSPPGEVIGEGPSDYALQSIPAERLALYEQAGRRYEIDWTFLASIAAQECASGTCAGANSSGCAGPMQIAYIRESPCSPGPGPTLWERYGVSIHAGQPASVDDPGDAIFTAARFLRQDMGAPATGGSYAQYRQAACRYYGACAQGAVAYAEEVMARAVQYGFKGAGSPNPSSPPLAEAPSETEPSACATSASAAGEPSQRAQAIVRLAESQIGQGETPEGSNCTRYGPCEEWCSLFVSWVWQHTGVPLPGSPADYGYSGSLYTWVAEHGGSVLPPTATPAPGDAVFYGQGPGESLHVGIVARVLADGEIVTVEGNYANHVTRVGPFNPDEAVSAAGQAAPVYGYAEPPTSARKPRGR